MNWTTIERAKLIDVPRLQMRAAKFEFLVENHKWDCLFECGSNLLTEQEARSMMEVMRPEARKLFLIEIDLTKEVVQ